MRVWEQLEVLRRSVAMARPGQPVLRREAALALLTTMAELARHAEALQALVSDLQTTLSRLVDERDPR